MVVKTFRWRSSSRASSHASQTSFASQISSDSVDPSVRVAEEFEKLVSEFTEELKRAGLGHRLSARRIQNWFSTRGHSSSKSGLSQSSQLRGFVTEPVLRCMDVMQNFSEVLSLWEEFRGDEIVQRRQEKSMDQARRRAERFGMSFKEKMSQNAETSRNANASFNIRDHKRQQLIELYGEMSYFFTKYLPKMKKKESIEELEVQFTEEMSKYECRLLKIILGEDFISDTKDSGPQQYIKRPA